MSPCFYSVLVEIEKADNADQFTRQKLLQMGGVEGYIRAWRNDPANAGVEASDDDIIEFARSRHPSVFAEVRRFGDE